MFTRDTGKDPKGILKSLRDLRVIQSRLPSKNFPFRWPYADALTPQVIGSYQKVQFKFGQFYCQKVLPITFLISLLRTKQNKWKPFQELHVLFFQIFENVCNICSKSFLVQAKHFQLLPQCPIQEKNNELVVKGPGPTNFRLCSLKKVNEPLRSSPSSSVK